MTQRDDDARQGELLDLTAEEIERISRRSFDELKDRLGKGESPRAAIAAVLKGFEGPFYNVLAGSFSQALQRSVGIQEVRDWPVGKITLSQALYRNHQMVTASAMGVIREHVAGMTSVRETALELYEGYGYRSREALDVRKALPKYIRNAPLASEVERVITRFRASSLKTPSLRAAYLAALDAIEKKAEDTVLAKRLEVAYHERNRYLANRIAQTETQRAYADKKDGGMLADPSVEFVQWRLSNTHPATDICDLHAKLDAYGLGPGVYPKALAPRRPAHPFCRCRLVPRFDLSGATVTPVPNAVRDWLARQSVTDGARVLGSRERLQQMLDGADLASVINRGVPEGYGYRLLGGAAKPHSGGSEIVDSLINHVASAPTDPAERLEFLWSNPAKYAKHVGKRVRLGHVTSAKEYAEKTFQVLSMASTMTVAHPSNPEMRVTAKVQVRDAGWVVLLSDEGRIVTSYEYDPSMPQFEETHTKMGDKLYEYPIPEEYRALLASLFGIR